MVTAEPRAPSTYTRSLPIRDTMRALIRMATISPMMPAVNSRSYTLGVRWKWLPESGEQQAK